MPIMTPGNGFRTIFLVNSIYIAVINLIFPGPVALLHILHSPLVLTFFNVVLLVGGLLLLVSMFLNHYHRKSAADAFELAGLIIVGGLIFIGAIANFSPNYTPASGVPTWHTPLGYIAEFMVVEGAILRVIYLVQSTRRNFQRSKKELENLQKENTLLAKESDLERG